MHCQPVQRIFLRKLDRLLEVPWVTYLDQIADRVLVVDKDAVFAHIIRIIVTCVSDDNLGVRIFYRLFMLPNRRRVPIRPIPECIFELPVSFS